MSNVRFIGLDVHAETIAVAVAEPDGEVRSLGVIPNRPESIRKLVKKLGPAGQLRVCYEAGPTGYVVYWELTYLVVNRETPGATTASTHCPSIRTPSRPTRALPCRPSTWKPRSLPDRTTGDSGRTCRR